MPRLKRDLDFNPPVDATRQDIVDAVETSETNISDKLEESNMRLERIDGELEHILGEEVDL